VTQYKAGLEDQDRPGDLIERGATAVSRSALMHVVMGCRVAQYELTEPYATRHAGEPTSIAAECYTAV
jgi:hypothetical protein